jgi:hypothetical protein
MPILLKRFHHRGAVPRWAHDRAKLWNGAEMRERNGKRGKNAGAFKTDARTAHDLLFTFPAEKLFGLLSAERIYHRPIASPTFQEPPCYIISDIDIARGRAAGAWPLDGMMNLRK